MPRRPDSNAQDLQRGSTTFCRKSVPPAVRPSALARVGLPNDREFRRRLSSQISVGQAQRVLIAMATMHSPALLIADEPTSALDAVTQVEILNMLEQLNREAGSALLYISHDLQSVASICGRIAILQEGTIVECGPTASVLQNPKHPYTQRLLACAPWLPWWNQQLRHRDSRERLAFPSTTPIPPSPGLKSPHLLPMQ